MYALRLRPFLVYLLYPAWTFNLSLKLCVLSWISDQCRLGYVVENLPQIKPNIGQTDRCPDDQEACAGGDRHDVYHLYRLLG